MPETDKRVINNNFRHATILVVEDNQDHWVLIEAALKESLPEVNVVWVANADDAISYLDKCVADDRPLPKLVLLDLYLPQAEPAWQLLRTIKAPNSEFIRMPVVVFSYSNNREDISELYTFGGTSFITKPGDFNQWLRYFDAMRNYWWETVTLPSERY